jgi:hypothetical protein
MFGSGAKTIGTIVIRMRQMIARRGLIMIIVLSLENVCGAVPGASVPIDAVPLTVTTPTAATPA